MRVVAWLRLPGQRHQCQDRLVVLPDGELRPGLHLQQLLHRVVPRRLDADDGALQAGSQVGAAKVAPGLS